MLSCWRLLHTICNIILWSHLLVWYSVHSCFPHYRSQYIYLSCVSHLFCSCSIDTKLWSVYHDWLYHCFIYFFIKYLFFPCNMLQTASFFVMWSLNFKVRYFIVCYDNSQTINWYYLLNQFTLHFQFTHTDFLEIVIDFCLFIFTYSTSLFLYKTYTIIHIHIYIQLYIYTYVYIHIHIQTYTSAAIHFRFCY